MTCSDCDEMFLDYFEGTLSGDARARFDRHASSCARCQTLIRDVNGIREEAAMLPELTPSRDLWSEIDARIQPSVIPIVSRPSSLLSKKWLAVAAAALIAVTSGVTYVATMKSFATRSGTPALSAQKPAPMVAVTNSEATVAGVPSISAGTAAPPVGPKATAVSRHEREAVTPRSTARASLASSASAAPITASETAFAGEISQLENVLVQRRSQLDPETVKVVEDNLNVIDAAVKRARSALARDPASGFLMRQLDNTLQKKVELLRTVALLPAST